MKLVIFMKPRSGYSCVTGDLCCLYALTMLICCCMCNFTSSATGFDGEQALAVQLLQFGRRKRQVISGEPLPLSHKSYLSWLGFTAEGESVQEKMFNSPGNIS